MMEGSPGEYARKVAQDVLTRFYKAQPGHPEPEAFFPLRVERLVRHRGWKLEEVADIGFMADGTPILGRALLQDKCIEVAVDAASNKAERRFTIAHELGHLELRHPAPACCQAPLRVRPQRQRDDTMRTRKDPLEQAANSFAVQLLMPEEAVKRRFAEMFRPSVRLGSSMARRFGGDDWSNERDTPLRALATKLAKHKPQGAGPTLTDFFGVSTEAMARRLVELGCVTA